MYPRRPDLTARPIIGAVSAKDASASAGFGHDRGRDAARSVDDSSYADHYFWFCVSGFELEVSGSGSRVSDFGFGPSFWFGDDRRREVPLAVDASDLRTRRLRHLSLSLLRGTSLIKNRPDPITQPPNSTPLTQPLSSNPLHCKDLTVMSPANPVVGKREHRSWEGPLAVDASDLRTRRLRHEEVAPVGGGGGSLTWGLNPVYNPV